MRLSRCLAMLLLTYIGSAAAWAHPQSTINVLVAGHVTLQLNRWLRQGVATTAALVACVWLVQRVPVALLATGQS